MERAVRLLRDDPPPNRKLMHGAQHSAPASARRKMPQGVKYSRQAVPKGTVAGIISAGGFHRPINQKRSAHNGVTIDKAPIAAILTMVSIVAHRKIFSRRDCHLVACNIFTKLRPPLTDNVNRNHLTLEWRERIVEGVISYPRIVHCIGLLQRFAIDIDLLIDQLYVISRQTNHTLHKVLMILVWIFKNDDIPSLQRTVREHLLIPCAAPSKNELVHQQVVANQERSFHRSGRNLERLYDKAGPKQGQNYSYEQ